MKKQGCQGLNDGKKDARYHKEGRGRAGKNLPAALVDSMSYQDGTCHEEQVNSDKFQTKKKRG